MSGFFSLGAEAIGIGKHQDQDQEHDDNDDGIISPYSLYLFKNQEIYTKGNNLELWHYELADRRRKSFVDDLNQKAISSWNMSGYGIGSGSGSGGMNCQDCGNQAKKDCEHMRCRTCCKSRGFHCQTHVKSTWVPAAKRRERQHRLMSISQPQSLGNQQLSLMMSGGSGDQNPKRLREDHHHQSIGGGGGMGVILSNQQQQQHQNAASGLEVGHFPAEVNSPAVFRCVRVSAMDDAEEQLAYQTALNIGGHVFKGILYDHGPETRYNNVNPGEGTSSGGGGGGLQPLITTAAATAATGINPGVNFIDPSSTYPTPFSAFMAGTQFFPPPRS